MKRLESTLYHQNEGPAFKVKGPPALSKKLKYPKKSNVTILPPGFRRI